MTKKEAPETCNICEEKATTRNRRTAKKAETGTWTNARARATHAWTFRKTWPSGTTTTQTHPTCDRHDSETRRRAAENPWTSGAEATRER